MALVLATLQSGFAALFKGQHVFPGETVGRFPTSADEAAAAWAAVYKTYAAAGQSCKGIFPLPAALTTAEATLKAALKTAFQGTDPASTASALASAFTSFWLTPPVSFPPDGLVTVVAGTASLSAGLVSQWASNLAILPPGVSADAAASQHATLFDTFTRTVTVSHTAPPPCALPLV